MRSLPDPLLRLLRDDPRNHYLVEAGVYYSGPYRDNRLSPPFAMIAANDPEWPPSVSPKPAEDSSDTLTTLMSRTSPLMAPLSPCPQPVSGLSLDETAPETNWVLPTPCPTEPKPR